MKEKMKKTKIVCTIGPASESPKMLKKLVLAGMGDNVPENVLQVVNAELNKVKKK